MWAKHQISQHVWPFYPNILILSPFLIWDFLLDNHQYCKVNCWLGWKQKIWTITKTQKLRKLHNFTIMQPLKPETDYAYPRSHITIMTLIYFPALCWTAVLAISNLSLSKQLKAAKSCIRTSPTLLPPHSSSSSVTLILYSVSGPQYVFQMQGSTWWAWLCFLPVITCITPHPLSSLLHNLPAVS